MNRELDLKTDNDAVLVSTVSIYDLMPKYMRTDFGYKYETCLFPKNGDSEVLARYDSLSDAEAGHEKWCKEYGVSNDD